MNDPDEVADDVALAKAKLIEVAATVDPLGPLRRRPILTIVVAAAAGAVLAAGEGTLTRLIPAARAMSSLVGLITAAFDRFVTPPAGAQANAADTDPTQPAAPSAAAP